MAETRRHQKTEELKQYEDGEALQKQREDLQKKIAAARQSQSAIGESNPFSLRFACSVRFTIVGCSHFRSTAFFAHHAYASLSPMANAPLGHRFSSAPLQCECRALPGMLKLTTSSSSSVSLIVQRFPVFVNLLKNPDFPIRYALTHCKNGRFFRF